MRYLVPGSADDFPRCVPERLRAFGPWSAQLDPNGALLTAVDFPTSGYGEPRQTADGLTYWPPVNTPDISQLMRKRIVVEECNHVELANGQRILIRPAYLEPRRIFSTGVIGDPITAHGQRARRVMDLLLAKDPQGVAHPEALALWIEAVGVVYRATPELIDDMAMFSIEDVDNVLAAVFQGPKPQPGADTSPSSSPG